MIPEFGFDGHIYHVLEALDYGDAVSNQAIELDAMLRRLGLSTSLHSKWCHDNVKDLRSDIEGVVPTERDVVVFHFSGYSEYALPLIDSIRCTKVCIYHNITPHTFFQPGTLLHEHCLKGREQLLEISRNFHYFWGDSLFNIQELIELGVDNDKCFVLPIIVRKPDITLSRESLREKGSWIFLGRVAANKGHSDLVQAFANIRKKNPVYANKLYLVGGYQATDPYYQKLVKKIKTLNLKDCVILTGKVSDEEVENYLNRASIYVSMSLHEGFGVPLIEAVFHNLPVVALQNTAVGETMGNGLGLACSSEELRQITVKALKDKVYIKKLLDFQQNNASRFSPEAVEVHLIDALCKVIPKQSMFNNVSIVVCTINRAELLDRCLDYLQYQTNCNFEVIVVNGPSTDSTNEVLDKYRDRIKIGHNSERNLSVSRNIGIELSSGDLIAFIDDDALPFDDWVDTLLSEFNRLPLSYAGIGGPAYYAGSLEFQAQDNGINKFAEAWVNIDSSEIGSNGWLRYPTGTNCCFKSDVLIKAKGFDEQFDYYLDESELCYRLQIDRKLIGYCPDLYLRHEFAQSHNRSGKYDYNWFTISKNTAYFIAAYSGLHGKELLEYVDNRMYSERIMPIQAANNAGEISEEECLRHLKAIRSGFSQGLADAEGFPKTRVLNRTHTDLKFYISGVSNAEKQQVFEKYHICIISKEFPPFVRGGGVGTLYYHLASELLMMGHHVSVVVPGGEDSVYKRGRFSVRYTKLRSICSDTHGANGFANNINWSVSALHAVAALHSEQPIDVIDSALWDSEALALSLIPNFKRPPIVVRLVTPFPVSARINGWDVPIREFSLYQEAERTLISNVDAVVPISESIAETIETEYSITRDSRWSKSHCGIAYWPFFDVNRGYAELDEVFKELKEIPPDSKIILFVGRLEGRKGIDLLLNAAEIFLEADCSAHLVIAGRDVEGWEQRTSQLNANEKTKNRIHFLGEVDDETREKLLHAAYCLVFPSRYESFGLVPLEAFVHGTPVVASKSGAIPEIVVDGFCGLLFVPNNVNSLADKVVSLLSNQELRVNLSKGAKQQIKKYSSRETALRAQKMYSLLVRKKY